MKLTLTNKSNQTLIENHVMTRKWAHGLLSGEWIQYRGAMCDKTIPRSACCLHVAAVECDGFLWIKGHNAAGPSQISAGNSFSYLAGKIICEKEDGEIYGPADLNDELGLTFGQITWLLIMGECTI